MSVATAVLDCPSCGSAGTVYRWSCEICQLDPLPPPQLHPSIPLRFIDVILELRSIAEMASNPHELDGSSVGAACQRAEALLLVLRRQFLSDVVESALEALSSGATFTSRSPSRPDRFTSAG